MALPPAGVVSTTLLPSNFVTCALVKSPHELGNPAEAAGLNASATNATTTTRTDANDTPHQ
jgi:hypothetical protein